MIDLSKIQVTPAEAKEYIAAIHLAQDAIGQKTIEKRAAQDALERLAKKLEAVGG